MTHDFAHRLRVLQEEKESVLCVGLDPDLDRIPDHLLRSFSPAEAVVKFNRAIIRATQGAACAYKLNLAFYEALGRRGFEVLEETMDVLPEDVLTIADAKRGDIGNSARFYADALFEQLGCDACTVSPYMGRDCVLPFLEYEGKAAFVLARTTNPGAQDLQECRCEGEALYLRVARLVARWNESSAGTAGLVAGATDLDALGALREHGPTLPFLIPGVGAQGGDPQQVMQVAASEQGGVLVNSSRSIIYASEDDDFAEAAGQAAERLREVLNG